MRGFILKESGNVSVLTAEKTNTGAATVAIELKTETGQARGSTWNDVTPLCRVQNVIPKKLSGFGF